MYSTQRGLHEGGNRVYWTNWIPSIDAGCVVVIEIRVSFQERQWYTVQDPVISYWDLNSHINFFYVITKRVNIYSTDIVTPNHSIGGVRRSGVGWGSGSGVSGVLLWIQDFLISKIN